MLSGMARLGLVSVALGCLIGATPASKREKKSEFATYPAFVAAHYLACPEIFSDSAVARYLAADSARGYGDYRRASESDPEKRKAILEDTRNNIRQRAQKSYRPDQVYTLKDVEIEAGAYDLVRKGFEVRFPRSIGVGGKLPPQGDYQYPWAELREGTGLPPAVVAVTAEFPPSVPFAWDQAKRSMFVPVEQRAAEEFAAAYPPGNPVNLGNDGVRKARAYLDVKVTGCYADPSGASFMRGVVARVTGMRLYSMSSSNKSAADLVFEWADGAP